MYFGFLGQGQAERATARKKIYDVPRTADGFAYSADQRRFAVRCGLQERARRRRHLCGTKSLDRRGAHRNDFTVPRQARQPKRVAQAR